MDFTEEQKIIFDFIENGTGNGIIDAVAGAGKTTTIMECAKSVPANKTVLFCAFNKKIASEIEERFHEEQVFGVNVFTIHSLGLSILNNRSVQKYRLNNNKYKSLINSIDIKNTMETYFNEILRLYGVNRNLEDRQTINLIKFHSIRFTDRLVEINQKYRSTLCNDNLDDFKSLIAHYGIFGENLYRCNNTNEEIKIYFEAHKILLENGNQISHNQYIIDYTDMLYLPNEWKLFPISGYDFLFVDECQDLSKSQLEIVLKFINPTGRIIAVGDPQQSIYGFTGADIESFSRIKEKTNAISLKLTGCFRCPRSAIRLAQTIKKEIKGKKNEEGIIDQLRFDEIPFVAANRDLVISRLNRDIIKLLLQFIILGKKVYIHKLLAEELINELKFPFKEDELNRRIISSQSLNEILDIVKNRLKYIYEANSKRISDLDEREFSLTSDIEYLQERLDLIKDRWHAWRNDNIISIINKIKEFITDEKDGIELSSIHRAKGLERERVFIVNFDKLPFSRPDHQDWEKEQELNLKYVAITRVKEELFLIVEDPQPLQVTITATNTTNASVYNSSMEKVGMIPFSINWRDALNKSFFVKFNDIKKEVKILREELNYNVIFSSPPPAPLPAPIIKLHSTPSKLDVYNSSMVKIGVTTLTLNQKEYLGQNLIIRYQNQSQSVKISTTRSFYHIEFETIVSKPSQPPPPDIPKIYIKIKSKPTGLEVFDAKMDLLGKTEISIEQKPHIGKEIFVKNKDIIKSVIINSNQKEYQIHFKRRNFNLLYISLFILFAAISFGFYSNLDFGSLKLFSKSTEFNDSTGIQRTDKSEIINPVAPVYKNYDQTVANYLSTVGEKQEVVLKAYEELQSEYFFLINGKSNREIVSINSELGIIWKDRIKSYNSQNNKDVTDDFGKSASDILYDFFEKLNNGDCNGASLLQKNPLWQGSNNFCNEVKFGNLNTIEIKLLKVLNNEQNASTIYARYSAVENGIPKIYTQKFLVENKLFNGKNRWFITKLINIQPIFVSDINHIPEKTIFYGILEVRDSFFSVPFMILENGNYKDVPCQNKNNSFKQRIESVFDNQSFYKVTSKYGVIRIRPEGFKDLIPYGEEYSDEIRSVQAYLPNRLEGVCSNDPSIGLINQEKKISFDIFSFAEAREYPDYYRSGFLGTLDINNDGIKEYFYQLVSGDSCFFDWHYEVYSYVSGNWKLLFKSRTYTLD